MFMTLPGGTVVELTLRGGKGIYSVYKGEKLIGRVWSLAGPRGASWTDGTDFRGTRKAMVRALVYNAVRAEAHAGKIVTTVVLTPQGMEATLQRLALCWSGLGLGGRAENIGGGLQAEYQTLVSGKAWGTLVRHERLLGAAA